MLQSHVSSTANMHTHTRDIIYNTVWCILTCGCIYIYRMYLYVCTVYIYMCVCARVSVYVYVYVHVYYYTSLYYTSNEKSTSIFISTCTNIYKHTKLMLDGVFCLSTATCRGNRVPRLTTALHWDVNLLMTQRAPPISNFLEWT